MYMYWIGLPSTVAGRAFSIPWGEVAVVGCHVSLEKQYIADEEE
jgi:hypothetical protein